MSQRVSQDWTFERSGSLEQSCFGFPVSFFRLFNQLQSLSLRHFFKPALQKVPSTHSSEVRQSNPERTFEAFW